MNKFKNHITTTVLCAVMGILSSDAFGQGTFQNLDFESANVPTIPSGSSGGFVPVASGLPGWNAYLGTNQQTQVLHNSLTAGSSFVGIMGPDFSSITRIQGSYTAFLFGGVNPDIGNVDASIGQTGTIPGAARSIQFKTNPGHGEITIRIGGQLIPVVALQSFSTYTLFGGDVSFFSGQVAELRITAVSDYINHGPNAFAIDSILFSNQSVPEPSAFCLLGLGALLYCCQKSRKET